MSYIGLIYKEEKSDFGVVFPDFPGCVTAGKTLEEAKDMGQEARRNHAPATILKKTLDLNLNSRHLY